MAEVTARVAAAAGRSGRSPDEVAILAASKRRSHDEVRAAAEAGITVFGENYVQDLVDKAEAMPHLAWHFIGHLQRNKVKKLAPHVSLIHTLDSTRLADALARHSGGIVALVQVNVSGEDSKSGCAPEAVPDLLDHIADRCPALQVRGFMTIPPAGADPTPHFQALRRLRDEQEQRLGRALPELSMGMSGDLEAAIACGATIVRIGTALFGPRT